MGLLSWLFGWRGRAGFVANLQGQGSYGFGIVGESHYQDSLGRICGGRTYNGHEYIVDARIVHDDNNEHDNKAVRVEIEGEVVAYFNRKDARKYRKQIAESGYPGVDAICSAMIVGGWDRGDGDTGHYGVKLDLPVDE